MDNMCITPPIYTISFKYFSAIIVTKSDILTDRIRIYLPSMTIRTHNVVHLESIHIVVSVFPLLIREAIASKFYWSHRFSF